MSIKLQLFVYLNDELKTEGQVLNLAYLYLGAEVPYRAAIVMEKGMADDIIDRTPKNLETLGQAWLQAKNLPQALKAFEGASKLSDTGELQYRIEISVKTPDSYSDPLHPLIGRYQKEKHFLKYLLPVC